MTYREHWEKMLPIIQAFVNGQTIQYKGGGDDSWEDIEPYENIGFDTLSVNYRIKPEPKYRPFKTVEECWQEMHKHPDFGWVKRVQEPAYLKLNKIEEIGRVDGWNFENIFDKITFTDGTPFGIKEE